MTLYVVFDSYEGVITVRGIFTTEELARQAIKQDHADNLEKEQPCSYIEVPTDEFNSSEMGWV